MEEPKIKGSEKREPTKKEIQEQINKLIKRRCEYRQKLFIYQSDKQDSQSDIKSCLKELDAIDELLTEYMDKVNKHGKNK